jgi:hypothetical protein
MTLAAGTRLGLYEIVAPRSIQLNRASEEEK